MERSLLDSCLIVKQEVKQEKESNLMERDELVSRASFYLDMYCTTHKEFYLTLYNETVKQYEPSHVDVTVQSMEADKADFGF